ncbi:hypothetical protein [Mycoplasmopsis felis]|uniref:hypothetical protein n=1 Tax=Mycoplasmopsis felis TaxID=33923 RepID=UPI002AFFA8AE|nr:hypothetical protein [Mycoplasmopsis felis]WQQ06653.1 hypothetical protein RRG37_02250 [Mycoplasmopsis felis]
MRHLSEFINVFGKGKSAKKKRIFLILFILLFLIFVSLVILFLPLKDGSTIENIIQEFKEQNKWNSKTITSLIISGLAWILIIWKLTLSILDTMLYFKRKKKFENEIKLNNELNPYIPNKEQKKQMLTFKQQDKYVHIVVNELLQSISNTNQRLSGSAIIEIKEILYSATKSRKIKINEVKAILENNSIITTNKEIIKALKNI